MKNELKNIFTAHWTYLAVNAVCKLNIFDALESPKTVKEATNELHLNEDELQMLFDALCYSGFLKHDNNTYCLTEKSELLTDKNSESLKYACKNWAEEHLTVWQNLDYLIKTGNSVFEHLYQSNFFDYLENFPDKLDDYHKAMYEYARDDYKTLPDKIDFNKHKSIMDVGGGYGAAINAIKKSFPHIKCFLFDLPEVTQKAKVRNIQKIGGDFFVKIPKIADAIILSRVLHDWSDEKANIILRNCFEALPTNGTLYVIENCSDKIQTDLSMLSLNMAAMCKSYERSALQYVELCTNQQFVYHTDKKLNDLQTILIFKKP